MTLLCFVIDVSRIHGAILKSIQQCLLELGDLAALRIHRGGGAVSKCEAIGLCTLCRDSTSGSYKLEIRCEAKAPFNLRDYHHAVNSLVNSSTSFVEGQQGDGQVSCLSTLLEKSFTWFPQSSSKRTIVISSSFFDRPDNFRQTVLEAAKRCIMIDFIEIDVSEHSNDPCLYAQPKTSGQFQMDITEFENCTFQSAQWNSATMSSFVKTWLQELGSDDEGPLEGMLVFPVPLINDTTGVYCTFYPAVLRLSDVIKPCEACRCHGTSLIPTTRNQRIACPVTGKDLDNLDLANNCVKVGEGTVLLLPSFKNPPNPPVFHKAGGPPVLFTVLGCVYLALLSEGLLFGLPHVVLPSSDDVDVELSPGDGPELTNNDQTFTALCQELHSRDSALLCSSSTDLETGLDTSFLCFYILLPGQSGSLLAKRISSSEELLPVPPSLRTVKDVPDHVKNSVTACLSKMEAQTYDPLQHERGCYSKLDGLLKESLQIRANNPRVYVPEIQPRQQPQTSKEPLLKTKFRRIKQGKVQ